MIKTKTMRLTKNIDHISREIYLKSVNLKENHLLNRLDISYGESILDGIIKWDLSSLWKRCVQQCRLTEEVRQTHAGSTLPSVLCSVLTGKCLFKAIGYQAMGSIIRGYAYLYPVSLYDLNPVFFHAAGKDTCNNDVIIALNFHGPPAHNPGHQAFQFN